MKRHQHDGVLSCVVVIDLRKQSDPLHKLRQGKLRIFLFKIVNYRFELQQVFDPSLGFHRILKLEVFQIARLYKKSVIDVGNLQVVLFLTVLPEGCDHFPDAVHRLGRKPFDDFVVRQGVEQALVPN